MKIDSKNMIPQRNLSRLNLSLTSDIMRCTISWCRFFPAKKESMTSDMHHHIAAEIHYICRGCQRFSFPNGTSVEVSAGSYIFIPQKCQHSMAYLDEDTEKFVVGFNVETTCGAILSVWQNCDDPAATVAESPVVTALVDLLRIANDHPKFEFHQSTKYIVNGLIAEVLENEAARMGVRNFMPGYRMNKSDERMDAITMYVEEHIFENICTEDVANYIGLQSRQANRICKKYTMRTINQYISDRRIEFIKDLLANSTYSLTQISEMAGFSNVYSFIRYFHNHAGMPPGAYRRDAAHR